MRASQSMSRGRRTSRPPRAAAASTGKLIWTSAALAERMHLAQRRRREHGLRVALIALDVVGEAELLEQPQHALRARVVEVVDDDHGLCSASTRSKRRSGTSHQSATKA